MAGRGDETGTTTTSAAALHPNGVAPRFTDVRRVVGISSFVVVGTMLLEGARAMLLGHRPMLDQSEALIDYQTRTATGMLVVVTIDTFLMTALLVFLGAFRQLVSEARRDLRWIADIAFGAGIAFVAITLVGDAMAGGAALDTVGTEPDASSIRALTVGHILMFGVVGGVLTALVMSAFGVIVLNTHLLPRWVGFAAFALAGTNLLTVPTSFMGTDPDFWASSGGWATTAFATMPFLLWTGLVGVLTIRGQRAHEAHLLRRARVGA